MFAKSKRWMVLSVLPGMVACSGAGSPSPDNAALADTSQSVENSASANSLQSLDSTVIVQGAQNSQNTTSEEILQSTQSIDSAEVVNSPESIESDQGTGDAVTVAQSQSSDTVDSTDVQIKTLNEANANAVILQAFDVLSGRAYDGRLTEFPYTTTTTIDSRIRYYSQECNNAGDVTQSEPVIDDHSINQSIYTDCQLGSDTLNGRVLLDQSTSCCNFRREFGDNFSVNFQPGGVMELSGSYEVHPSNSGERRISVNDFSYHFSYSGGALSVFDATTDRFFDTSASPFEDFPIASMTGSFSMQPPVLDGAMVEVTVTEDFVNTSTISQLMYERGQMRIKSGDTELVVNATTNDKKTVELTLTNSSTVTITRTENWSTWFDALSYIPPDVQNHTAAPAVSGDGSVITPNNYKTILEEVFSVFSGARFRGEILDLPGYPVPDFPPGSLAQNAPDGFGDPIEQQCVNGGSTELTPYKFGFRQITSGWNTEFANCEFDGQLYDGQFFTRDFGNLLYTSTGLTIASSTDTRRFAGTIDYKFRSNRDGGPQRHYWLSAANYESTASADKLSAASFFFTRNVPFSARLIGHFSLSSQATSGATISVNVADPFVYKIVGEPSTTVANPSVTQFQSGQMVIRAGNNNTMWINAASDDAESFVVTIAQPGRELVTLVEPWGEGF